MTKTMTTSKMFIGPLSSSQVIRIAQEARKMVLSYTSDEMTEELIRIRNIRFAAERQEIETTLRMRIAG